MKRGRKPKPTKLKILQGNPGKRPLPATPDAAPGKPSCPKHLGGEARKEWHRISRELLRLGLLSRIDRAALAGYCQSWARWVAAEEHLAREGAVHADPARTAELPELARVEAAAWLGWQNSLEDAEKETVTKGTPAVTRKETKGQAGDARFLDIVLDVIDRRARFGAARPSPWIQESKQALLAMHRFLTEFGLTPATRARLDLGAGEPDELQKFFGRSG